MSVLKTWISLVVLLSVVLIGCGKEPSCTDGIQNQGETGVDCCAVGTNCDVCPICILNPEDTMTTTPDPVDTMVTMVDDPQITAKVNGDDWSSTMVTAVETDLNVLNMVGLAENASQIQLTFSEDFATGTYEYLVNFGIYQTGSMVSYQVDGTQGGSLVFSTFDTTSKTVSGTFEFTAINQADNTDTLQITEGMFTDIVYE